MNEVIPMASEQTTAGDLTTEHYGFLITFESPPRAGGFAPLRREIVCDELRRWIYNGQRRVGITDFTPSGAFIGTEHHLSAETPVTVLRRIRKARKRPWGKGALKPGETWADIEGIDHDDHT